MQINALPCRWGKDLFVFYPKSTMRTQRTGEAGHFPGGKTTANERVHLCPLLSNTAALSCFPLPTSSHSASQNSTKLPYKYPISFWLQQLLLQDSLAWLWFVVFPCIGVIVPCDFTSRMGPRKVINLQFVQIFFFLVRVGMIISKLPTCPR